MSGVVTLWAAHWSLVHRKSISSWWQAKHDTTACLQSRRKVNSNSWKYRKSPLQTEIVFADDASCRAWTSHKTREELRRTRFCTWWRVVRDAWRFMAWDTEVVATASPGWLQCTTVAWYCSTHGDCCCSFTPIQRQRVCIHWQPWDRNKFHVSEWEVCDETLLCRTESHSRQDFGISEGI